jgi:hypothetical protein
MPPTVNPPNRRSAMCFPPSVGWCAPAVRPTQLREAAY